MLAFSIRAPSRPRDSLGRRDADLAGVALQERARRSFVVHHRLGIRVAAEQGQLHLQPALRGIRIEDRSVRETGELREPAPHVRRARIEAAGLLEGIVDPRIRRQVGADAGDPLPIPRGERRIVLRQVVVPLVASDPPVDPEIEAQERGGDRAHARVHPAGRAQLADPRVDQRIAGAPAAPRIEMTVRPRETEAAHLRLQRLIRKRLVVPRELQKEIALRERVARTTSRAAIVPNDSAVESREVSPAAGTLRAAPYCSAGPARNACSLARAAVSPTGSSDAGCAPNSSGIGSASLAISTGTNVAVPASAGGSSVRHCAWNGTKAR